MSRHRWKRVVLLGGTGFCGAHLAEHLVTEALAQDIVLVDIHEPRTGVFTPRIDELVRTGRVEFVRGDVREPLRVPGPAADLIVNLAAVHREPGHRAEEYFATNLPGARHACDLAREHGCREMIFVSSISVYGAQDGPISEDTALRPTSPYGESKRQAEEIHREWLREDESRRLATLRPGVLYGPGERANVSRMVRAVVRHRFAYVGSPDVPKAGLYVGEFTRAALWCMDQARAGAGNRGPRELLANLTAQPAPTVREYVEAVGEISGVRPRVPTVPTAVAVAASAVVYGAARLFGRRLDIHPERVWKLARPNAVSSQALSRGGYEPRYSLREAMQEWRRLRPDEWQ
jgi:nucleoside-diphosphate-sugar epimerase